MSRTWLYTFRTGFPRGEWMDALAVSLDRQARGSDGNDGGDENGGGGMGEGQSGGAEGMAGRRERRAYATHSNKMNIPPSEDSAMGAIHCAPASRPAGSFPGRPSPLATMTSSGT